MIKIPIKFKGNAFNGQAPVIVRQEMAKAMQESLLLTETEVAKNTPVTFGIARASINGRFISPFNGVVGSSANYIEWVERGRRPGKFPPIDAITLWVRRKLKVDPKLLKSVGFLVARKIAKKGTKGAFMFREGEKIMRPIVLRRFRMATQRIGQRLSK